MGDSQRRLKNSSAFSAGLGVGHVAVEPVVREVQKPHVADGRKRSPGVGLCGGVGVHVVVVVVFATN